MHTGTDLSPILPVLAKVFDQALEGGGAKNINFQELAADLAQITFDYPFRIPPYFALIIRAISVLEGIALTGDPDFALVDEAYPYIAKRLLTDRSPRLQAALRYMVSPIRQREVAAAACEAGRLASGLCGCSCASSFLCLRPLLCIRLQMTPSFHSHVLLPMTQQDVSSCCFAQQRSCASNTCTSLPALTSSGHPALETLPRL